MLRFIRLANTFVVVPASLASHIGDLNAGITLDWTSISSGRSMVLNFPRQRAVVAMATQVTPIAVFGAEPSWGLEQQNISLFQHHSLILSL